MTNQEIAATFAQALTIADNAYGHDGRGCALAGREPFGPGACKPCSLAVLLERETPDPLPGIIARANIRAMRRARTTNRANAAFAAFQAR